MSFIGIAIGSPSSQYLKVYLFTDTPQPFEVNETGLALVGPKDLPSNFLESFRLILNPGKLVLVSGQIRFTRDQWREFATQLEAHGGRAAMRE